MSTTWSQLGTPDSPLTVKAVCTTGTEAAPTAATAGLSLDVAPSGFTVIVESAATAFTAGTLQAYLYSAFTNAGAGSWVRFPDGDLSVQALTGQGYSGVQVVAPRGRIAYVPAGLGQACNVYLLASVAGR